MKKKGLGAGLVLVIAMSLVGCVKDVNTAARQTGVKAEDTKLLESSQVVEEQVEETTENTEVNKDNGEVPYELSDTYKVVKDGVEMDIPKTYVVCFNDTNGDLYVSDDDGDWDLVFVTRDGSYEKAMEAPDRLMDAAKSKGVTIDKAISEVNVDGKNYAYFTFTYNDGSGTNTVVHTGVSDNKRVGINLLRKSDISDEDLLKELAVFLNTVRESSKPNTTNADLVAQEIEPIGEVKEEVNLSVDDSSYSVSVPTGYYSISAYDGDGYTVEEFSTQHLEKSIQIGVYTDESFDMTPEEYIEHVAIEIEPDDKQYKDVSISDIQHTTINGVEVAYKTCVYTKKYSDGNTRFSKLYAVIEQADGSLVAMEMYSLDDAIITLEDITPFIR